MEIVKFKKNQALIRQGEIANEMYEIITGQVGIYMDYGDAAQKEIGILSGGDYLGELELIDSSTRIASAIALDNDVTAKKLSMEDFNNFVKENPAKVILIIQQLSSRVRSLDNHYLDACRTIEEFKKAVDEKRELSPELLNNIRNFTSAAKKRG